MDRKAFFKERLPRYRKDPVLYFKEVLNFTPDDWQAEAAILLANNPRVTIRSGQGVGKTAFEAACLLWFLTCFSFPRIVATAPTRQQVNDVLWAEVSKWQDRSPLLRSLLIWTKTYIYMAGYERQWFAVARVSKRPESIQGFHADNMLIIVDEASGVPDPIMEAIRGTLTGENNKLLMCGNPNRTSGMFYESHTSDRRHYCALHVNSRLCDRTNKENIEALEEKYGRESNVVRVRVDGEFPTQEDDVFIPLELCESAALLDIAEDDLAEDAGKTITSLDIGCDVARYGSDETVIATLAGDYMYPLIVRHGQDLMRTAGDILRLAEHLHEKFPQYFTPVEKDGPPRRLFVKIDDTGLGGGVSDRIIEVQKQNHMDWFVVIRINFSQSIKHIKAAHYYNDIATYMWACARDRLREKSLRLPNDADLMGQLSTRKFFVCSNGKIQLESKDDMKKRDLKSPDRGDAVALACLPFKSRK